MNGKSVWQILPTQANGKKIWHLMWKADPDHVLWNSIGMFATIKAAKAMAAHLRRPPIRI
jgi:hypothetical protein